MATVLKIVYGKDIRRCSISDPASLTWPAVVRRIGDLLGVSMDTLHVTYTDDEGDLVSIYSTEELAEAIRLSKLSQPPILRLTVSKKPTPPTSPPRARDGAEARAQAPDLNALLGALASEMPMLRPIVNRVKYGVAIARGDAPPHDGLPQHFGGPSREPAPQPRGNSTEPKPAAAAAAPSSSAPPAPAANFACVHPMHTCDACDASPIVGVRYHSRVVPNYDLCERCFAAEGLKAGEARPAFEESFAAMRHPPCGGLGGPWRGRGCRGGYGGGGGFGGGGGYQQGGYGGGGGYQQAGGYQQQQGGGGYGGGGY